MADVLQAQQAAGDHGQAHSLSDELIQQLQSAVQRRIWGSPEAIMLIFAGSAAEFALSKAVDWLFWTNALPDAPIDRFFETVRFAQQIAFGQPEQVRAALEGVKRAHGGVERSRGARIPQWAYRDVLFMLIDYGERAHAIVFGPMNEAERLHHYRGSVGIGRALGIEGLPDDYAAYQELRRNHLQENTAHTSWTDQLYARYREHLGAWRFRALLDLQASLVPRHVSTLLGLKRKRSTDWLLGNYRRLLRGRRLRSLYPLLLPGDYGRQLAKLERE